jgi:hypothetical protein
MFKLVVTLFLITNGVPADEPSAKIPNNKVFPSEEACRGYFDTDAGKLSKQALEIMIGTHGEKFEMKVSCTSISKGEQI